MDLNNLPSPRYGTSGAVRAGGGKVFCMSLILKFLDDIRRFSMLAFYTINIETGEDIHLDRISLLRRCRDSLLFYDASTCNTPCSKIISLPLWVHTRAARLLQVLTLEDCFEDSGVFASSGCHG